ncbi:hypothetical protein [Bradyrhizobium sp. Gha]|uniref:hypothetical protein n=1 Tax=Bradyrhizobium sp. Gha TaxID=1855318 RepID=UPI0008E5B683|nr:hypothetical protein [Bradyrhizobium sp. Gha]SFJ80223.1 hypothetical protein SAMN05216525_13662 [Bradyrhizobium sp. Gha]
MPERTNSVEIATVGGATNAAHVSQVVQQSLTQTTSLPSFTRRELGISQEGIDDLQKAIGDPDTKAEKAKQWASDAGKYIGKEGLKVGLEVAKRTALQWIGTYLSSSIESGSGGSMPSKVGMSASGQDTRTHVEKIWSALPRMADSVRRGATSEMGQFRTPAA